MTPDTNYNAFRSYIDSMTIDLPDDVRPLPDQVEPFIGLPDAAGLRDMLDLLLDRDAGQSWQPPPKRRPSDRELLREWVSQARPLVLKPIVSMEKATMKDYKFDDENDTSWATWDLLGPAALIVGALLGLVGLWLWGGW